MKNHIWFREFDWRALAHKKIKPPYVPSQVFENLSRKDLKKELNQFNKEQNSHSMAVQNVINNRDMDFQNHFVNFEFNRDDQLERRRNENLINQNAKKLLADNDMGRMGQP